MAIGDAFGRAVVLDFPKDEVVTPTSQKEPMPYDKGLIPEYQQGIQMDAEGMESLFYNAVGNLRNMAAEYAKQGIDVTGAPNLADPKAIEAVELFKTGVNKVREMGERLRQGREHQKLILQASLDGKVFTSDQFNNPGGIIGSGDVSQMAFGQNPKFIDRYNRILSKEPATEEDYEKLKWLYGQAITNIQQLVDRNEIAPQAAEYWKRQIRKPPGFDWEMRATNLESKKARARKNRAQARKYDDDIAQVWDPKTRALAEFVATDTLSEGLRPGNTFRADFFEGTKFRGRANSAFKELYEEQPGSYVAKFDVYEKRKNEYGKEETAKKTKEVRFSKSDILPAVFATLSESEARQMRKELSRAGFKGKASANEYLNFADSQFGTDTELKDSVGDYLNILPKSPQKNQPHTKTKKRDPGGYFNK